MEGRTREGVCETGAETHRGEERPEAPFINFRRRILTPALLVPVSRPTSHFSVRLAGGFVTSCLNRSRTCALIVHDLTVLASHHHGAPAVRGKFEGPDQNRRIRRGYPGALATSTWLERIATADRVSDNHRTSRDRGFSSGPATEQPEGFGRPTGEPGVSRGWPTFPESGSWPRPAAGSLAPFPQSPLDRRPQPQLGCP